MKLDLQHIAAKLNEKGLRSNSINIEDLITEEILTQINPPLEAWTSQVTEIMQELEHPEPRNIDEYRERIGADKE